MITLCERFHCKQVSADADILCLSFISQKTKQMSAGLIKAEIEKSSVFQVSCDWRKSSAEIISDEEDTDQIIATQS